MPLGGDGGNITIDSPTGNVIVDQSQIIADAVLGDGGDISVTARGFLASPDSIISASSEFGVAGNIEIASPATDIAGSLVQLPESLELLAERFDKPAVIGDEKVLFVSFGCAAGPVVAAGEEPRLIGDRELVMHVV